MSAVVVVGATLAVIAAMWGVLSAVRRDRQHRVDGPARAAGRSASVLIVALVVVGACGIAAMIAGLTVV